ncbi:erythromycin esterase family protein [Pontibacter locisalis]|uniref:Erythromycin esterase family protein n=1 Tax=Pontibacter locisalis TaxID=1719035 RepID=A0ABW5IIB9_9BACT
MKTNMLIRRLPFMLLLCLSLQGFSQPTDERVAYLKANASVVKNIDPDNEDYSDLDPLKGALKDKIVVGLGEQTHYDGQTFKAKTRLVKFLHQKLGYSVLAFESGFYDCYKAWQQIQEGKPAIEAARKSIYPFWVSEETEELFRYIDRQKNTEHPLVIAGIDCKFSSAYSRENLLPDFEAYLQKSGSTALQDTAEWGKFKAALKNAIAYSDYLNKLSEADTLALHNTLNRVLVELDDQAEVQRAPVQENFFWRQFCRSTLTEARKKFTKVQVRDVQMGENLVFLQRELYKDRKVIVWAASSHLTYNGTNIEREFYQNNLRLGDHIRQAYGEAYYNIGFTGYRGKIGKLLFFHLINVKKHKEGSIEYALGQTGYPFLFLDLNRPDLPKWLQEPLVARPFGYREMRMRIPQVMDGLFYTREIFERKPVPRPENNL